ACCCMPGHRAISRPARQPAAHTPCRAARPGLYTGRRRPSAGRGAAVIARRNPRRHQLLSALAQYTGRQGIAGSVPGRGLSGDGRREAGRSCPTTPGLQLPCNDSRRCDHARAGLLPGALRTIARRDDQRTATRPHDGRQTRSAAASRGGIGMGTQRIFIPRDSAAIAVGADAVARAVAHEAEARGLQVEIVRNGSRGLLWLETFVEVETPAGRYAYGPVEADDVASLFDAGWLQGGAHRLAHGLTEDIPYLKHQERLTFARTGITDPLSLTDYQKHGGLEGLRQALAMTPEAIV